MWEFQYLGDGRDESRLHDETHLMNMRYTLGDIEQALNEYINPAKDRE